MQSSSRKFSRTYQSVVFTSDTVKHISELAQIPLQNSEEKPLANGFTATMKVVDTLQKIDTTDIEATSQVTGKENTFRDDVVDVKRMFSQNDALKNTNSSYNGYFIVNQILDKE